MRDLRSPLALLLLVACIQRIDQAAPSSDDAGTHDGGSWAADGGSSGVDASPPGLDATADMDASTPGPDAASADAAPAGPDAEAAGPDAAPPGPDACTPRTCAESPNACGPVSDGCGGTLDCRCPYTLGCDADAGACACDPVPRVRSLDATGGLFVALAFDAQGTLHVSSTNVDASEVRHGWAPGGAVWSFQSEVVDSTTDPKVGFRGTGITAAPDGRLDLVYLRYVSASPSGNLQDVELWHAVRLPGQGWLRQKVLDLGRQAYVYSETLSVLRTGDGTVHAALVDYSRTSLAGDVVHASVSAGSNVWDAQTVFAGASVSDWTPGGAPALAADSQGGLHLLFHDYTARSLRYASREAGGSWAIQPAALDGPATATERAGNDAALFVAADGTRHATWLHRIDSTKVVLKYGRAAPAAAWVVEDVDPPQGTSGSAGYPSAVAVDGQGVVHALYGPGTRYATRDGNGWTLGRLETATTTLTSPRVLLDAAGAVFFGYGDWVSDSRATLKVGHRCR